MTIHRLVQIIGPACLWTLLLIGLAYVWQPWTIDWIPWLFDVLAANRKATWAVLGCALLLSVYLTPPREYRTMDPEILAALHSMPLSRLYGRSTGLLFLEVVALLAVASIAAIILAFPIVDVLFGKPSRGVNQAHLWGFGIGYVTLGISLNLLRPYIYPLP